MLFSQPWGTSINDVPRFLAFFDLPTYLRPFLSHLEKAAHLMTSLFAWPTYPTIFFLRYIKNRPKINNSYQNQNNSYNTFWWSKFALNLVVKIKSTYSKAGNFKINFANFLFFLFSSFYLVQKKWDVPSWPTYQPTMSLLRPTMLDLPTYPK